MQNHSRYLTIDFASLEPYECGARLIAILAQPDKLDDDEAMGRLFASLCHLVLRARLETDDLWARTPQLIKPLYAMRREKDVDRDLRTFKRRLRDRLIAARMAIGFLQEVTAERPFVLPKGIKRLSLNEMAELVSDDLDGAEQNNIETRIWRPSLPVVHIAAAMAVLMDQVQRESGHALTIGDFLINPSLIRLVIDRSNTYADLLLKSSHLMLDARKLVRVKALG